MKIPKFSNLNDKLQTAVKLIAAVLFLAPLANTCIKVSKPYYGFVKSGPELVNNVDKLKKAINVLTGVVSADLEYVDEFTYSAKLNGDIVTGRLKKTISGNIYIFVSDADVGERTFVINYNYDKDHYYFFDFNGNYVKLIKL